MAIKAEVHWHEGLFLQPHHLQAMQHDFGERLAVERAAARPYPYGLVESSLSADALENLRVQFDRLSVVMPGGLRVSVPDNADLPALSIKEAFEAGHGTFTVYLGVPLWYAERANTLDGDDVREKRRFRVAETERRDENTGENAQPVPVRRINARLLLDGDDQSDLEVIPILRIAHATGDEVGLPRQDTRFIPPCLVLGGSPTLRDLVRDLANQVEASRKELVIQISRGGFKVENMKGLQFEQMLRLRTLNRFSALLPHLAQAPGISPFEVYLQLRVLLGELAALYPERDQFDAPDYDHHQPALAFQDLGEKIRGMLRGAVAPSYLKVAFAPEGDILIAHLGAEHLAGPNAYYLGIRTKEDPQSLAALVEDQDKFKLMAQSLAGRAIWGVKLALDRVPPLELPSEAGLIYFRLMRDESARMWERIDAEKAIAARWPGMETSDYRLTLYMTVPAGGGTP
jgi:type VI secretion system ImpJ/VasE family protein